MKKVFLDTNLIVDLIADRKPFSKCAIEIFQMAEANELLLFTSSHSIATTHYLFKKYLGEAALREVLLHLLDFVTVIAVDTSILKKGLRSARKDFEDSIQILSVSSVAGMDYIVTRNIRDFKGSEIPVLAPEELFLNL